MAALAQQQPAALNRLIAAIAPTNPFNRRKLAEADGLLGKVAREVLPVFEFKSRRWRILP